MGKTATDGREPFFSSTGRILLTVINKSIHNTSSEDPYGTGRNDCDSCTQRLLLEPAQRILVPVEIQETVKSHAKYSIIF